MVEQAATEIGDKVKVFEIDIDKNQKTAAEFNIMSIPALLFFKGGEEVSRLGMAKKDDILKALQSLAN